MRLLVRRANIDPKLREQFELYGEQVMALALGVPLSGFKPSPPQTLVESHPEEVKAWLRQKRHEEEQTKTRLELCEWAILFFLIISVVIELSAFFKSQSGIVMPPNPSTKEYPRDGG
jgi:hypothetical protein